LHPVQVLKSHLRLIRGSMILDHIRTRFLGRDLYARATYMQVYTVYQKLEIFVAVVSWRSSSHGILLL